MKMRRCDSSYAARSWRRAPGVFGCRVRRLLVSQTKNYEQLRNDFGTADGQRDPMAPGWRPGHSLAGLAGFGEGCRTHRRASAAEGSARWLGGSFARQAGPEGYVGWRAGVGRRA